MPLAQISPGGALLKAEGRGEGNCKTYGWSSDNPVLHREEEDRYCQDKLPFPKTLGELSAILSTDTKLVTTPLEQWFSTCRS